MLKFNRGCRLRDEPIHPGVLIPEGFLKLSPSGLEILRLCDGVKSVREITEDLKRKRSPELSVTIESETVSFLQSLCAKTVLVKR